jgi:phosphopantothenoylcysteine decarboxylase/phosphopantothenate--cysteine ligase
MCAARILFKLSGSISAWKACAVISKLVQDGHEVQTVATEAALRFVGAATLEGLTGRAVASDLWEAGAAMEHINLVKWADVVVLCPATANTINKLAAGSGEDLVGALFLAHDWHKPYLLAPAMNPAMWSHPATIESVDRLKSWGVRVLPVGSGRLACGDEGEGRLLEPEILLAHIRAAIGQQHPPANILRVLITSGGTEEAVDGVRTLGNFSTGRTGAMIAEGFAAAGHEVTLLRSKRAVQATNGCVRQEIFVGFSDLQSALMRELGNGSFDVVIHAAAVGDYSIANIEAGGVVSQPGTGKIDSGQNVSIRLRPNAKLVDHLRSWSGNPDLRVVAFKLTNGADELTAKRAIDGLFDHSQADAVVHNDLVQNDEKSGAFPATIWSPNGSRLAVDNRHDLAAAIARVLDDVASTKTPVRPVANPS